MKPVLLVDVDGVLAPFKVGHFTAFDGSLPRMVKPWAPVHAEYVQHPVHGIFYSPDNARRLKELEESYELHWGTGWQHEANRVIGPIHGFEEPWPVMEIDILKATKVAFGEISDWGTTCDVRDSTHWKITSIHQYAKDRPVAFIDDEISEGDIEWAAHRTATVAPTLFVPTDATEGMTDEHVLILKKWAETLDKTS